MTSKPIWALVKQNITYKEYNQVAKVLFKNEATFNKGDFSFAIISRYITSKKEGGMLVYTNNLRIYLQTKLTGRKEIRLSLKQIQDKLGIDGLQEWTPEYIFGTSNQVDPFLQAHAVSSCSDTYIKMGTIRRKGNQRKSVSDNEVESPQNLVDLTQVTGYEDDFKPEQVDSDTSQTFKKLDVVIKQEKPTSQRQSKLKAKQQITSMISSPTKPLNTTKLPTKNSTADEKRSSSSSSSTSSSSGYRNTNRSATGSDNGNNSDNNGNPTYNDEVHNNRELLFNDDDSEPSVSKKRGEIPSKAKRTLNIDKAEKEKITKGKKRVNGDDKKRKYDEDDSPPKKKALQPKINDMVVVVKGPHVGSIGRLTWVEEDGSNLGIVNVSGGSRPVRLEDMTVAFGINASFDEQKDIVEAKKVESNKKENEKDTTNEGENDAADNQTNNVGQATNNCELTERQNKEVRDKIKKEGISTAMVQKAADDTNRVGK